LDCSVQCGGNTFKNLGDLITVDDSVLLSMKRGKDGNLEFSLILYDQNNNLLASIEDNEWTSGDHSVFDIEASYRLLVIRKKKGNVGLRINCKQSPMLISGDLWSSGTRLSLTPGSIVAHTADGKRKPFSLQQSVLAKVGLRYDSLSQSLSLTDPSGPSVTFMSGPGDLQIAGVTITDGATYHAYPPPGFLHPSQRRGK
jgi:hypothetical protein